MSKGAGAVIALVNASEEDFAWMLRGENEPNRGLTLPPGNVDDTPTLEHVRNFMWALEEHDCLGSWMIAFEDEVVGLCGYHRPPEDGAVEIGYSVAASRRRRGFATAAVRAIIDIAKEDAAITTILAETTIENKASARVLASNGFHQSKTPTDLRSGQIRWSLQVREPK